MAGYSQAILGPLGVIQDMYLDNTYKGRGCSGVHLWEDEHAVTVIDRWVTPARFVGLEGSLCLLLRHGAGGGLKR